MVRAELDLKSILRQGGWLRHNTSIVHQHVQAVVLGIKCLSGLLDRGKRREIELEVFDEVRSIGYSSRNALHGIVILVLGSGAEIDLGRRVLGEMDEGFIAQTAVGAGDDNDLAGEEGNVRFWSERGGREGEHVGGGGRG
jgi:hypothetical protein